MSEKRKVCPVTWITFPAPNLGETIKLYTRIFGWKFQRYEDDYYIFDSGELQGGVSGKGRPSKDGMRFSITVEDIDATLELLVQSGCEIALPKFEIPGGFGFSATFVDCNGNYVELWSKS